MTSVRPHATHTTSTLCINGEDQTVVFPTHHTLLEVLREECGLTGTKHGCELGECGTCTVLVDGKPVLSCLLLAVDAGAGHTIETVEGLQDGNRLHPLQAAFADHGAAQCGYCTPGILMTAKALLAENSQPTADEVRAALAGNLCRCTGYSQIVQAVMACGVGDGPHPLDPPLLPALPPSQERGRAQEGGASPIPKRSRVGAVREPPSFWFAWSTTENNDRNGDRIRRRGERRSP